MDYNLIQYVSEFTDLRTALRIVLLCKWTTYNIKIKYVNDKKLCQKINDVILQQKKYKYLFELYAFNNP